jgi:hypothetical protein
MTDETDDEHSDGEQRSENMLNVELVLGAERDDPVRIAVSSAKEVDDERLEINVGEDGVDEYLAELGLMHTTDEFAGGA